MKLITLQGGNSNFLLKISPLEINKHYSITVFREKKLLQSISRIHSQVSSEWLHAYEALIATDHTTMNGSVSVLALHFLVYAQELLDCHS